jgi:hypothetical protein
MKKGGFYSFHLDTKKLCLLTSIPTGYFDAYKDWKEYKAKGAIPPFDRTIIRLSIIHIKKVGKTRIVCLSK